MTDTLRGGEDFGQRDYWKLFEKLILAADSGTTLSCLGWIFFWLDHIPQHLIHTHFLTAASFLAALVMGLYGTGILWISRNRLGTKTDRFFHFLKVTYTLMASVSGLAAIYFFPAH